ncbi:MAG: peptidoglycan DD-metalloendopeptidase family protein [Rickettsiales bacterium]|nr:peptidoglycan DD-metalloendopeptidase family protein [Rickettsiales bacterium]
MVNAFRKKRNCNNDINNLSFQDDISKEKIFMITTAVMVFCIIIFFILLSIRSDSKNKDIVEQPLKIVVLHPNNPVNVDEYETVDYKVKSGDTLYGILLQFNIASGDINSIINSLKNVFDIRKFKEGQTLKIRYKNIINVEGGDINEKIIIENIRFKTDEVANEIVVTLQEDGGGYASSLAPIRLVKNLMKYKVTINSSLFTDGIEAGVPQSVMMEFIKIFSFDIDFQRDLRVGDVFEVLFEGFYSDNGNKVKDGDILYASLDNGKITYEMYKFGGNYYDVNGKSVQKSLLKTPISGARITSNFGLRKHPILGYTKKHEGKDFAAPTGTPIFAAGNGTIIKSGRFGGFGNYVKIKHSGGYETEYAHASKIASGIRHGVKVKQGQIVAFVGSTGMSTGPHLHYGVLYNGRRINPDRVKALPSINLIGKNLDDFRREMERVDVIRDNLSNQSYRVY